MPCYNKNMLIDSHCHLHDRDFFTAEQAKEMLVRAKENNVLKVICIGTSLEDSLNARDFAKAHENVFWTLGIHPEGATKPYSYEELQDIITSSKEKLVAIGEVGLDYHYEPETKKQQIKLFETMLELATKNNLPLSFHVREAFDDFFGIINNLPAARGVVHSFSDSKKNLKKILEQTDFYVGVNGLATYSTLPTPPLDRILLETDAPVLAPVPHRGETNEPAYIKNIAEWLSSRLDTNFDSVASITTKNAKNLFQIQQKRLCYNQNMEEKTKSPKKAKLITGITTAVLGAGALAASLAFFIIDTNSKPGIRDAEFLVEKGTWVMQPDTQKSAPTDCVSSENDESINPEPFDCLTPASKEEKVIWSFTEIGKGTLTTNNHIDDHEFKWSIENGKLKIETEWLYTLYDELTYTLDQKAQTLEVQREDGTKQTFKVLSS